MATVTMKTPAPGGLSNKARELMEAINTDAGKLNIWVRTQANRRRRDRGSARRIAAKAPASSPPAGSPSTR